jgi:hypothetical protein
MPLMSDSDPMVTAQGAINELRAQVQMMSDRAATMGADLGTLRAELDALKNPQPPPNE